MFRVTVDRKWLDDELNADRSKAFDRAKKRGVKTAGSVVQLQGYFNTTQDAFHPGTPEHAFLAMYEPRITSEDIVVLS